MGAVADGLAGLIRELRVAYVVPFEPVLLDGERQTLVLLLRPVPSRAALRQSVTQRAHRADQGFGV